MSSNRQSPAVSMDEVLMEILLRLPAKSLIRFKSVCKKWLNLISSDHFCHQHTLRGPKLQHSLIIKMDTMQLFYFNINTKGGNMMIPYTLSVPHHHQILQDCNGLLLLEFDPKKEYHYVYDPNTQILERRPIYSYYVHNPTTRKSRNITVTNNDQFPYVGSITLVFDPSKSPYYKVVCARSAVNPNSRTRFEVYDSESHIWKLSLELSDCPRLIGKSGFYWNNSIIWSIPSGCGDRYCFFDIAKNEIKNLSSPPHCDNYAHGNCLQESNGHMYFIKFLKEHPSLSIGVWELGGDDHSQWLSKHRGEIHPHSFHYIRRVKFMGGWGGDTCSLLIYDESPPRFMTYNFLDNSYELLLSFSGQPIQPFGRVIKGFKFGETLALV